MVDIAYHCEGDYLIPNLVPPDPPKIGVWGRKRNRFLQQHHDGIYTGLLLSGRLNAHLEEIDRSAAEMFDLLIKQMAEKQGITEQLKAENQMAWVVAMNSIRNAAEEVVLNELIYS